MGTFTKVRNATLLAVASIGLMACSSEESDSPTGPELSAEDTTPPAVASATPGDGATDVPVGTSIVVLFSEDIELGSVSAGAMVVEREGGERVGGTAQASARALTLEPSADLEYATTYTVSLSDALTDTAGNALGSGHAWSFTTEAAPAPPFSLAIEPGRLWSYDVTWRRTVVGSSIGVDEEAFSGWTVLAAREEVPWKGRTAWRIVRYDIEADPGEHAFDRRVVHLADSPDGVEQWIDDASGGRWRRLMATDRAAFTENHFLLAGDPRGPTTEMSTSEVTVPAGTFTTLRARVDYRVTGRYEPEDIFETRVEHWAPGVGVVRATWDFSFDDNDPAAWDVFEQGVVELLPDGAGPADVVPEADPAGTPDLSSLQGLAPGRIVEGATSIAHPGLRVDGGGVYDNAAGEPVVQDWYRMALLGGATMRIDLDFDLYRNGAFNDLDLYLLRAGGSGLEVVAASTAEPGNPEWISGTLAPGVYYIAVQAWNTPNGTVGYGLSVR